MPKRFDSHSFYHLSIYGLMAQCFAAGSLTVATRTCV